MITFLTALVLGFISLLCYAAERSVSVFTWSRLEELNPPRPRRQAVERLLQERELVNTSFLVTGCVAVAGLAIVLIVRMPPSKWISLEVVLLLLFIIWILPEFIAWRLRDLFVLRVVPVIYPVVRVPFRALRILARASGTAGGARPGSETHPPSASDAGARELFRMAVRLKHITVREIMTPRTQMVAIAETATPRQAAAISLESGYSRLPVYRGDVDHVIGVLHAKDLLRSAATEKWDRPCLPELLRQPFFVPETKSVSDLMEEVLRSNTHMALVLDEYGGTGGVVTLEDVVEELIGDIHDEYETPQEAAPPFKWLDARRVELLAAMRVTEFNEECHADVPVQEDYDTVGGFVTFMLGRIPVKGESFKFGGGRMTVIEADPRRVIRVRADFDREVHRGGEG